MANPTITFVYGATSVTLPTPGYPGAPNEELKQFRSRSLGGRVWSVTQGIGTRNNPVLRWSDMTTAEFTTLRNFIHDTVSGSENEFTYTDHNGDSHTAVYMDGIPRAQMVDTDMWRVNLELALS